MAKEGNKSRFSDPLTFSFFNEKTQKWEVAFGEGKPPTEEEMAATRIYHRTGDMGPFIEYMDKMSEKAKKAKE